MRPSRLLFLLTALGGCADIFGFQDLRASDAGIDAPDDVANLPDVAPNDVSVPDEGVDALPPCEGGAKKICGAQCVDLASSQTDCGACNHDCGGGLCNAGVCAPVVLAQNLSNPVFDIDATTLYFSSGTKVLSCPITGCVLTPTQLEDTQTEVYGSNDASGVMEVANGNFFYVADPIQNTIRPTLFTCPISGCTTPMPLHNSGLLGGFPGAWGKGPQTTYWMIYKQLSFSTCTGEGQCSGEAAILSGFAAQVGSAQPITADANNVFFVHPDTSALTSCPATGTCASPATLLASAGTYKQIAVTGTNIYMVRSGTEGGIPADRSRCVRPRERARPRTSRRSFRIRCSSSPMRPV